MSDLTETEIVDRMRASFRSAIKHSLALADLALAKLPVDGPSYPALRDELQLIEGCARQMSAWREDSRWLQFGLHAAECHRRSGNWLRAKHPYKLFRELATALEAMMRATDRLRLTRTNSIGAILPEPLPTNRERRQVQVSKGGIIFPPGFPAAV